MESMIYIRVSTEEQKEKRQIVELEKLANKLDYKVKRKFIDKITGNIKASERSEFKKLLEYIDKYPVDCIIVSEVSRLGRKVSDVLNNVELFHSKGISLYIQNLGHHSLVDGKENSLVKMMLTMMALGAEMEMNYMIERRKQGIALSVAQGKYNGRKKGTKISDEEYLKKYPNAVELLSKGISIRKTASILKLSCKTIQKVKRILSFKC